MGRRPDRSLWALVCCRLAVVFFICACLLVVMVATDAVNLGSNAAAPAGGGLAERRTDFTTSFPARYSGGRPAGADAFRSSKRRIPKGADPIHNRRAGKTTIAPRRRD